MDLFVRYRCPGAVAADGPDRLRRDVTVEGGAVGHPFRAVMAVNRVVHGALVVPEPGKRDLRRWIYELIAECERAPLAERRAQRSRSSARRSVRPDERRPLQHRWIQSGG